MNIQKATYWDNRALEYGDDHKMANLRLVAQSDIVLALKEADADCVLDLGGGAGHLAVAIKQEMPGTRIIVVDSSEEMLTLARAALGAFEGATTLLSDMTSLAAIESGSIGAVVSTFALHHLTDESKRVALREARRVIRNGGALIVADEIFSNRTLIANPAAQMRRVAEVFYPTLTFEQVRQKLSGLLEYPTGIEEMSAFVSAAGFAAVWTTYNDIAALCVARAI
jgi:ubiquinone/menaquinone biosynthesis C-methylase UbiE